MQPHLPAQGSGHPTGVYPSPQSLQYPPPPYYSQHNVTHSLPFNPGYNPFIGSTQSQSMSPLANRQFEQFPPSTGEDQPSAPFVASAPPLPESGTGYHGYGSTGHYANPYDQSAYSTTYPAWETEDAGFRPPPLENHGQTERLIAKINELTSPHLPNDLRPTPSEESVDETYETLKSQWRDNAGRYTAFYQGHMNGAIRSTDQIVRSRQSHKSRQNMLLVALIALGILTLFGTHITERRYIAPNTLSIAKIICKIAAGVTFCQLAFSNPSNVNRLAASHAQLYLGQVMNNLQPNLPI